MRIWLTACLATAVAVILSYRHLDIPILMMFAPYARRMEFLGPKLGGPVLLSFEAVVFLTLAIARIVRGSLPPLGRAVAAACISSICAYSVNANMLKVSFGIEAPYRVLEGAPHMLHWFEGSPWSSFPSGHMVLAGAFAGVLMRLYPRFVPVLAAGLGAAAILLVTGCWHFLSDVLAGGFVGVTAGLLAAEIWLAHESTKAS